MRSEYLVECRSETRHKSRQPSALARTINIFNFHIFGEASGKRRGLLHYDGCWWYMKTLPRS